MAKGGKGRKGGGGGGGKTRKYSRDNNGRFASTGTGATARGGRLLTAKGNKRKTQTITAAGQKGVLAKPKGLKPGAIKPKPAANKVVASPRRLSGDQKIARDVMTNKKLTSDRQRVAEMQRRGIKPGTDMVGLVAGVRAKQGGGTTARIKPAAKPAAARAAAAKPARFSASELAERKGYAKQLMAQPKGVRKANYLQRKAQKNPDQLDRFKGRMKFGTQNTINNITEGRSYLTAKKSQFANTPEKRASIERSVTNSGRSLQARMKTTNLGTRLRRLNKPVTTKAAKIKGTIGKPKGLKPGNIKPKAAAKPARAARTPKTGQEVMKSEVRKVQNKRLRAINADIKSAGPNATSLRVEKLALKTRMIDTQPKQTAKQLAKSAKQDVAIRGRIAEMRKQNARVARAQSNVTKNADVRNSTAPMSKASFARRPSKKTMRSQLRADNALAFYANPAKALREVKKKPGFRKPRSMR